MRGFLQILEVLPLLSASRPSHEVHPFGGVEEELADSFRFESSFGFSFEEELTKKLGFQLSKS